MKEHQHTQDHKNNHSHRHGDHQHQHHQHDHGHSHGGGGGHTHIHTNNKKALFLSFLLITAFMIVEVIGGLYTGSLALLADAGHMLSDAIAMGLALFAFKIGEKAANSSKTYGYKRFEILAAFLNGLTLLIISITIVWEAVQRFSAPPEVASSGMLAVAVIGLIINIVVAFILMSGGDVKGNLNLRGAFLHVIGDLLGSIGAIIAGLLILFFGWSIADPIASLIVAVLILISGYRITKDAVHVLMEGKPDFINLDDVREELLRLPSVLGLHDLHSWSITSDFPALTVHLVVSGEANRDELLIEVKSLLEQKFHISHSTIQMESEKLPLEKPCN
ncbi:cation diffusion facilitator family transporter [Paenibacillus gallinarum]|uniref:Cation transporter n=1 Tax=Paenibacillus gallinarum TaxID=2762232 RepID=A0ABR8SWU6_9BACL|nr:cation diffusion facilitator family transporter [Paenibacillus gallinarum]MBD7967982.1 cation transporter [Paenibacillus gallinarum]